jgi:hypothetical protein
MDISSTGGRGLEQGRRPTRSILGMRGCRCPHGASGGCARRRASGRPWIRDAEGSGLLPVVREPGDITVVVAGADLAIPQLAYFPSWGFARCRVTREIIPAADG